MSNPHKGIIQTLQNTKTLSHPSEEQAPSAFLIKKLQNNPQNLQNPL